MSYVSVLPATLATAATEVARIGSALSLASAVAAAQTSAVQAAAADEVSAAIAALFSAHWPRVRGPMRSPRLPPHRRCRA
ncbi:PE-PGRS family protein [Mycobacterium tuberculosis]|nr:PE-PGRS family protein [Mycobacterium tuberculosis]